MGISSGPFGWPGGRPDRWDQGYYAYGTYLQSCSGTCSNDPQCVAYAMRGSTWVYSSRLGTCHIYHKCSADQIVYTGGNNNELWFMGSREQGITDSRCLIPSRNFGFGCEAGLEKRNGKCVSCSAGTFKSNFGSQKCQTCRKCPGGEFREGGCTASTDSICKPHSGYCANTEFQIQAANHLQDRECQSCKTCQPGEQVLRGCARGDPWYKTKYSGDSTGNAEGMIAVFQADSIKNRAVVVHGPNKEKIGCGILKSDPWKSTQWTSVGSVSEGKVTSFQENPIQNKVIVVHASDMTKIGCGKITGSDPRDMTAVIERFPGYNGGLNVAGSFKLGQAGSFIKGTYKLTGMENNKSGGYHIHTGESCSNVGGHFENKLVFSAQIKPFPGYTGSIKASGSFGFYQYKNAVRGQYSLSGVQGTGMFHLHSGSSCSNVGSHLFNDPNAVHVHKRRLIDADHPGDSVLTASAKDTVYTDANTKCSPCLEGDTFSTVEDQAVCKQVTICKTGEYVMKKPTAKTDTVCTKCSNAPSNSYYTSNAPFMMNNCKFACNKGFEKTNDGKNCAKPKQSIRFNRKDDTMGIFSYDDNTIKIKGTCLDYEPCSGTKDGKSLSEHISSIANALCTMKMTGSMKYVKGNTGMYILDDGFCRYNCDGNCPNAIPFDFVGDFGVNQPFN